MNILDFKKMNICLNEYSGFFEKNEYDSIATVGESRVWWRADFQSGSRVLKKVF